MRYFESTLVKGKIYECVDYHLVLEGGEKGRYINEETFYDHFKEVFPTLKDPITPLYFKGNKKKYLKKQRRFIKDNLRFKCKNTRRIVKMQTNGLVSLGHHSLYCNDPKFLDYYTPYIISLTDVFKLQVTHSVPQYHYGNYDGHQEVKEAFKRGEKIEGRMIGEQTWFDESTPLWLSCKEYRVKPKPIYVPYSWEDRFELIGKSFVCELGYPTMVIAVLDDGPNGYTFAESFEKLTHTDGTPFGKLKTK